MRMLLIAAIATALLPALPGTAAAQRETERVDRTVRLPANGTVSLKNFSGEVRITGTSGNDVVIKAIRRAERPQLDGIELSITTSGSTVRIDANDRSADWDDRDNNVVDTEFDIQVPAGARLDVDVFSSNLTITGVTGDQDLKTFSGQIVVRGARGELNLKSFSGNVEADLSEAGNRPAVQAETFSGDMRVRLAERAGGRVEFSGHNGSMESDIPLQVRSSGRRRTSADLPGGSGETLRFKTFSGELRIVR
jgi:DUF4097 and DUF4098 domain-containing protein YvlB